MQFFITGPEQALQEFSTRYGKPENFTFTSDPELGPDKSEKVVFDFFVDEDPERLVRYSDDEELLIFANIPKYCMADLAFQMGIPAYKLVGFNGLPTFIDRDLLEISLLKAEDEALVKKVASALNTNYRIVKDRVGMITPRVICQIINEAYYTVQEGTAQPSDIDLGMKLGTNYPMGPFEWSQKIGLANVNELLEALWHDTHDERYKVCPLLKSDYLRQEAGLSM